MVVYFLEFGFKRMEEEVVRGSVFLFNDEKKKDGDDDDDDDDEDEVDMEKLCVYEKSKLR